ncbi:MAG: helix-turn-helix domain-containing protein [Caldilineaceae bacterium]
MKLTPKEFELLRTLIANSDRVLEHNYLPAICDPAYIDQVDYLRSAHQLPAQEDRG